MFALCSLLLRCALCGNSFLATRFDIGNEMGEKSAHFFPCLWINAVTYPRAIHFPFDQAGAFQFCKMLRYGGLRQRKMVYNVSTHAGVLFCKKFQDGYPGRMRKCFRHSCDAILASGEFLFFRCAHCPIVDDASSLIYRNITI